MNPPAQAAERRVKEKWPDAHCAPYSNANYPKFYCIRGTRKEWALTIGEGQTPEHAWLDAAQKLVERKG